MFFSFDHPCQKFAQTPAVQEILRDRWTRAQQALHRMGFEPKSSKLLWGFSDATELDDAIASLDGILVDPVSKTALTLRSGVSLGAVGSQERCIFWLMVYRPESLAVNDLLGRLRTSEYTRRTLVSYGRSAAQEVVADVDSPDWEFLATSELPSSTSLIDELVVTGDWATLTQSAEADAQELARRVVSVLEP